MPEEQVAAAVEAALELVNMQDFMHRATHTLSGGQRQRVAIAGACVRDAGLGVLGEGPRFERQHSQPGAALLSATHPVEERARVSQCSRCCDKKGRGVMGGEATVVTDVFCVRAWPRCTC